MKRLAAVLTAVALVVMGFVVAPAAQAGLPHGAGPKPHYTVHKQPTLGTATTSTPRRSSLCPTRTAHPAL
jgi:hypothetical protein